MEDKDFDKIFKRTLEQAGGKPATEGGWAAMSERMNAARNKRMSWVLPLLIALISLLGVSNAFWWYQWKLATGQLPPASVQGIAKIDTIVKNTVVYHYDTVYRYVTTVQTWSEQRNTNVLAVAPPHSTLKAPITPNSLDPSPVEGVSAQNKTSHSAGATATGQNPKTPTIGQQTNDNTTANHPASAPATAQTPKTPPIDQQANDGKTAPPLFTADTTEAQTPTHQPLPNNLAIKTPETTKQAVQGNQDSIATLPVLPIVKKKRSAIFYMARPRIGLATGWAQPVLEERQSSSTWQGGAIADVEIAPKLRVEATLLYQKTNLSAYKSSSLGNQVWIPNPGSDFWLKYWEIENLRALIYGIQFKYTLPFLKNAHPYLGLGARGISVLPFEVEYEFHKYNSSTKLQEYARSKPHTKWQGMTLALGAEKQIGDTWAIGLEGLWLKNWEREPHVLNQQLGVSVKIYYLF